MELNLICPYAVSLDADKQTYSFHTDTDADYEVSFLSNALIFSDSALEGFEVSQIVITKVKAGTGVGDSKIKTTVAAIVDHFFLQDDRILTYVIESLDGRELSRKRLFQMWGNNHHNDSISAQLKKTITTEEMSYEVGLLYHKNNMAGEAVITKTFNDIAHILGEK